MKLTTVRTNQEGIERELKNIEAKTITNVYTFVEIGKLHLGLSGGTALSIHVDDGDMTIELHEPRP